MSARQPAGQQPPSDSIALLCSTSPTHHQQRAPNQGIPLLITGCGGSRPEGGVEPNPERLNHLRRRRNARLPHSRAPAPLPQGHTKMIARRGAAGGVKRNSQRACFSSFSPLAHCFSVALPTMSSDRFPLNVTAAMLCAPVAGGTFGATVSFSRAATPERLSDTIG